MFQGKRKALTFSYDDGVLQDKRIIEIFDKYGLKATFNLNSARLGQVGEQVFQHLNITVDHTKINAQDVASVYAGHEVAAHTLTHHRLTLLDDKGIIQQVEEDRKALSALVGYEVQGMAYPGGGENNNEHIAKVIKEHTGIKYARTVTSTYSFDMQEHLHQFHPTVFHREWDKMFELAERFIQLKPETPAVYYIWGHSYELDIFDEWSRFEEFCKLVSCHDDVFYGTNSEILL